ncbi:MAG: hypothetical protein AAF847_07225 [Bacteroidota bacterium]
MKDKDKIEHYFRSNLANYEENPPEFIWEQTLVELQSSPSKSYKFFVWILLLLFSALLLSTMVWSFNSKQMEGQDAETNEVEQAMAEIIKEGENYPSGETEVAANTNANGVPAKVMPSSPISTTDQRRNNWQLIQLTQPPIQHTVLRSTTAENVPIQLRKHISIADLTSSKTIPTIPTEVATISVEKEKKPIHISKYIGLKSLARQRHFYQQSFFDAQGEVANKQPVRSTVSNNVHAELEAGLILNHQWYVGLHLSHNRNREVLEFAVNESFTQQDIFVLIDGGPKRIPFEQTALFETLEGNLLVSAKTPEIEAGEKTFYIISQQQVRSQRIGLNAAYKLDARTSSIMPKIGFSGVFTTIEGPEALSARDGEDVFAVEAVRTSAVEPLHLVNIEGNIGFQAELPISKSRKWALMVESSYWFDLSPLFKNNQQQILRSNWASGVGIRYHLP